MHAILTKLLNKRKVKREQLSEEEKVWFDEKERILRGEPLKIESVKDFCSAQINLIEAQWKDLNNSTDKNNRLIIQHNVYSTLLQAINAPDIERVRLEEYLTNLINQ